MSDTDQLVQVDLTDTISINSTDYTMYNSTTPWGVGNLTTNVGFNGTYPNTTFTTNNTLAGSIGPNTLEVNGDANFNGDVKIKGVNIVKFLEDLQKRLAILVPDPAKLAHFEALQKAYDHYKLLEALCQLPPTNDK